MVWHFNENGRYFGEEGKLQKNPYLVLGVSEDATFAELQDAYTKLPALLSIFAKGSASISMEAVPSLSILRNLAYS